MTDETALLAAVLAAPDDDLPRLVYADWLDEHGQPERAAFIRVQVEIARLPADPKHRHWRNRARCQRCRRDDLRRLERELWFESGDGSSPVNAWAWFFRGTAWAHDYTVRRGFVESVQCESAAWLAHGDAVLATHPIREVSLTTNPQVVRSGSGQARATLFGDPRRVCWPREELLRAFALAMGYDPKRYDRELTPAELALVALRLRWPAVRVWQLSPRR